MLRIVDKRENCVNLYRNSQMYTERRYLGSSKEIGIFRLEKYSHEFDINLTALLGIHSFIKYNLIKFKNTVCLISE